MNDDILHVHLAVGGTKIVSMDKDGVLRDYEGNVIDIRECDSMTQQTTMTREEARKRFPNAKLPDE